MKAIFFMFLLCCICCLSCSDEQNTLSEEQNVIENKTFEKVSSLELKQQLLDYLNNSVKTRTTFNNAEMNYDLGMQEILRPQIQTFGEEMIVVRSKMDANNIMAFYKENGVIENCLIIECAQNAEDALEETMFTCYDSNNIPIFKAMVNKRNNTCNVLEIYDGLDDLTAVVEIGGAMYLLAWLVLYGQPLLEWLRLVRDLLWRLVGVCYKLGYVAPV